MLKKIVEIILGFFSKNKNIDSATRKGLEGEKKVDRLLSSLDKEEYFVLKNLTIKKGNQYAQIDHVVLSPYGVFVIETKNNSGVVYGKETDYEWTYLVGRKTYKLYNPIKQNLGHINALHALISEKMPDKDFSYETIVVYTGNIDISRLEINSIVVKSDSLISEITSFRTRRIKKLDLHLLKNFLELNDLTSAEVNEEHIQNIRRMKEEDGLNCPKCEVRLVERSGKYGNFLGCVNYPRCRYVYKRK